MSEKFALHILHSAHINDVFQWQMWLPVSVTVSAVSLTIDPSNKVNFKAFSKSR